MNMPISKMPIPPTRPLRSERREYLIQLMDADKFTAPEVQGMFRAVKNWEVSLSTIQRDIRWLNDFDVSEVPILEFDIPERTQEEITSIIPNSNYNSTCIHRSYEEDMYRLDLRPWLICLFIIFVTVGLGLFILSDVH